MLENRRAPVEQPAPDRLEPGRNGVVGRERVSEIQRARMLAAMIEEVSHRGAGNVTVAHVVAHSGVSRRTFYEIFDDREDCFLATFDDTIARVASEVVPAYRQPARWRERIRAGLTGLLSVLDAEPGFGRLLIVESLAAGPKALERRSRLVRTLTAAVDEGRREARRGGEPPASLTAEGVVGAVLAVLHGRLLARSAGRLVELANPLMSMIVLPYLGRAAARRELGASVASVNGTARGAGFDPLRDLQMRLTYRTVRVLLVVASGPGSSNRTIADGAGITDQGQVSKLLARLHGLGLVENAGSGGMRGGPNAWRLTRKGKEVHGALVDSAARA